MLVEQNIAGLEVSVDHISAMHVQHSSQELVHKILNMFLSEWLLGIDHSMKVGLHEIGNDVDIVVAGLIFREHNVQHGDEVFVVEEFLVS